MKKIKKSKPTRSDDFLLQPDDPLRSKKIKKDKSAKQSSKWSKKTYLREYYEEDYEH